MKNLLEGVSRDEERHEEAEGPEITPSRIPFPSLEESDDLNVRINANWNWQLVFDNRGIQKIQTLSKLSHGPEVVMVCIPEIIREECTPEGEEYADVGVMDCICPTK